MPPPPLHPDQIPEDADGKQLAAYVGEDIGRSLMLRLAAFVAVLAVLGGVLADGADQALRTASTVTGGVGAFALLLAGLMGVRRTRQWWLILTVLAVCGGLFTAMMLQVRGAS